jgi:hypothetical protein
MKKVLLSLTLIFLFLFGSVAMTGCMRTPKSCKASHKRVKKMRKNGQLTFF